MVEISLNGLLIRYVNTSTVDNTVAINEIKYQIILKLITKKLSRAFISATGAHLFLVVCHRTSFQQRKILYQTTK